MSGASLGSVGVNRVSKERLDTNVPRDYRQWVHEKGILPRGGSPYFTGVPFSFWCKALGVACAASAAFFWVNRRLYTTTVTSMTPEFQDAARQIGPVAERQEAPPVFLNPITNRIPGYIRGPDDIPAGP